MSINANLSKIMPYSNHSYGWRRDCMAKTCYHIYATQPLIRKRRIQQNWQRRLICNSSENCSFLTKEENCRRHCSPRCPLSVSLINNDNHTVLASPQRRIDLYGGHQDVTYGLLTKRDGSQLSHLFVPQIAAVSPTGHCDYRLELRARTLQLCLLYGRQRQSINFNLFAQ